MSGVPPRLFACRQPRPLSPTASLLPRRRSWRTGREHRRVGAERLALAAHWCDLHAVDEGRLVDPLFGRPRAKRSGADGTPEVDEFAAEHLGVLLAVHPNAAQSLMTDAVNLRHRHPKLWREVAAGEVVDWVATKTARLVAAAGLDVNRARWVDAATHAYAASLPPSRYFALVEAKIIEADTIAAEKRRQDHELSRFVRTGQATEHGIKTVVARASAGDVIYFDAVVGRLAQILALRGDTDDLDVRRSKAIGILASPAQALELLAWAESGATPDEPDNEETEPDDEPRRNDPARNAAIAEAIAGTDPDTLRPRATLHVHLTLEALTAGVGVARLEGAGPITVPAASDFLRHCHVTILPVLDLDGPQPVDGYEVPTRIGNAVRILVPYESFPWSTRSSRGAELDHSRRYLPPNRGGPPKQTRLDNLGPLTRGDTASRRTRQDGTSSNQHPASTSGARPPATGPESMPPAPTG